MERCGRVSVLVSSLFCVLFAYVHRWISAPKEGVVSQPRSTVIVSYHSHKRIYMSDTCAFISLFIYLFVRLFIRLPVRLFIRLFVRLSSYSES